jgi:hypothetical protein
MAASGAGPGSSVARGRPETMATTAPMMIAAAMSVRGVICSPRMRAPSATATIGLT